MANNMIFPKRKVLKKWVRMSLLSVILLIYLSSFYMILTSFKKPDENENLLLYSYLVKQDLDYKVNLYDNSYIENKFLGENETYIADLIKEIEVDFNYSFSGSKLIPLKYSYSVMAIIHGQYNVDDEESKVWSKEYTIKNTKIVNLKDATNINVVEPIKVDFNYYNNVVSQFRQELKLPITANLKLLFKLNVTGKVDGERINDEKQMSLNIPLNKQAFKITEDVNNLYNRNIKPTIEKKEKILYKKLFAGLIAFVIDTLTFMLLFRDIFKIPKKNAYTVKLGKILKEYSSVIVEIINPVDDPNLNIVEVKSFSEMIDLEEELRVPIMFYEVIEYLEGEFTLVHNNILYKYILKND